MNYVNHALCGRVGYTILPKQANGTRPIKMDSAWEAANIVTVTVPQLVGLDAGNGPNFNGKIRFHKDGVYQLLKAFEEVEALGLKHHLLTFAGAFYPRMIRGSIETPSEHSFGTAFDINAGWNGLGRTPAQMGAKGSVRELVPIFQKWGFKWGGDWKRADGMHFQIQRWIKSGGVVAKPVLKPTVTPEPEKLIIDWNGNDYTVTQLIEKLGRHKVEKVTEKLEDARIYVKSSPEFK